MSADVSTKWKAIKHRLQQLKIQVQQTENVLAFSFIEVRIQNSDIYSEPTFLFTRRRLQIFTACVLFICLGHVFKAKTLLYLEQTGVQYYFRLNLQRFSTFSTCFTVLGK